MKLPSSKYLILFFLLKYGYFGSFPSDYVPTFPNGTLVIIDTQPSNMQGER